ncbi:MAG: alpha/beta fold hydrolase, partial [Thiothrix sp.]
MLNYRWYGENTAATPLVVLHGLLGSLENWHSFANAQAGQRRVLAVDLRNHGRSPHVSGMSYREMVTDVLAVLAQEALTTIDLIGHSMGGKVA